MDKLTSSKLELALVTPDAIQAWNTVVKARGLFFILDYTTHSPVLFVGTKDREPQPWMYVDTRRKSILKLPLNGDEGLAVQDLTERLAKLGLTLTVRFDQVKTTKQKFISLRLVSIHGGAMTTVLDRLKKGQRRTYVQFALNERW